MERTRTGSKLACRPALVLFILYGASRAIERERDWQHGLQSGTEGVLGASRAIERERDWQHGLQSGTEGVLGASRAIERERDWQHGLLFSQKGSGASRAVERIDLDEKASGNFKK